MRNFSDKVEKLLKTTYVVDEDKSPDYRKYILTEKYSKNDDEVELDLFASLGVEDDRKEVLEEEVAVKAVPIIWGTDDYSENGYSFNDPVSDVSIIIPRSQKAKDVQKKRVKAKAEVYTPSWVCNRMNNLVDNETVYPNAFNFENDDKTWTPTESPVKFDGKEWLDYIKSTRLEYTMGEAPFICSRYDTVSGDPIPVRDEEGLFQRIGLLDRKLRVVAENVDKKNWFILAKEAFNSTYGNEWQGDSLYLARKNALETFVDYYEDFFGKEPSQKQIEEIAEIISWNFFQTDGLKMVIPMSCSEDCVACKKKEKAGHDGVAVAIRQADNENKVYNIFPFEEFIIAFS